MNVLQIIITSALMMQSLDLFLSVGRIFLWSLVFEVRYFKALVLWATYVLWCGRAFIAQWRQTGYWSSIYRRSCLMRWCISVLCALVMRHKVNVFCDLAHGTCDFVTMHFFVVLHLHKMEHGIYGRPKFICTFQHFDYDWSLTHTELKKGLNPVLWNCPDNFSDVH